MNKTLVFVAVVALGAGAAVGYFALRSRLPDLAPVGANRDLAPASLAVYAEIPDMSGTWAKMKPTQAWKDLAGSKAAEMVLQTGIVKDFLAALEDASAKTAYPLDTANVMKFAGRNCAVGIDLDAGGGAPQFLVLTKLDADALAKDLLGGKLDLAALQAELQRRTGKLDFAVTTAPYKGRTIATMSRGTSKLFGTLIGDTMAVGTSEALVRASVDCGAAGGEGSVGHKAAFQADLKALPADTSAFEWFDIDTLEARRASMDAGLASFGVDTRGVAAFHGVLQGMHGVHSFARAELVPDGDLYNAKWVYSKKQDLFADQATPVLGDLCPGDWLVYGEVREMGSVAAAWNKSELRTKLGASEMGRWLDGAMDDPMQKFQDLQSMTRGRPSRRRPGGAPGAAPGDGSPVDKFAMHMGKHVLTQALGSLAAGDTAIALDWAGKPDTMPRMAWTLRLGTDGHILALAAQAAMLDKDSGDVTCEDCGSRKVFTGGGSDGAHWCIVGDTLIVSNELELVREAARSGGAKPAGAPSRAREAAAAMKPGWRAFLHFDFERAQKSYEAYAQSEELPPQVKQIVDLYRDLGVFPRQVAMSAYLPDDFSSFELRSRTWLAEPKSAEMKAARAAMENLEPRSWASLPDTTFLHVTSAADVPHAIWAAMKQVLTVAGTKQGDVESQFRDATEMDLEKEVMPALGREFYLALTYHADPSKPPKPAKASDVVLPGVLLGIEVKNAPTIQKLIDHVLAMVESKASDPSAASPAKLFVHEARNGTDIVRLELPPEQQDGMPVHPALAMHDGFLVISSDVEVLRSAVDAKAGKAKCVADTPVFARAVQALGRKTTAFMLVDWSRMLDQIAIYAPMMGGLAGSGDVPMPEYPEDANAEEWQRRMHDYETKMDEVRKTGAVTVRKWIDSFRVVDYLGTSATVSGQVEDSAMIVQFAK